MSSRNMVTKMAAPDIALALIVTTSSIGKPPQKKVCFLGGITTSPYVFRRRIVAPNALISRTFWARDAKVWESGWDSLHRRKLWEESGKENFGIFFFIELSIFLVVSNQDEEFQELKAEKSNCWISAMSRDDARYKESPLKRLSL